MNNNSCTLTIFFGDTDESVGQAAKLVDPSSWLLTKSNYKELINRPINKDTVVYTSLGDLPKDLKLVYEILSSADRIVYCPPPTWSDKQTSDFVDPGSSVQGLTETLLLLLPESVKIDNFDLKIPDPNPLVDCRKSSQPQLWNAGCSISHGIGVSSKQRYGQLLANELGMPCSFLTRPGSAIDWAADQILRSDIRPDDVVVWGLTNPERLTYIHNHRLLPGVTVSYFQRHPEYKHILNIDDLYSQNTIYKHLYSIQQVINYCKKCQATLILTVLAFGNYSLLSFLKKQKNYVHILHSLTSDHSNLQIQYIDLGTDNNHPGPKQHQHYKNSILNKIKQLNYFN